jgi:DNA repair exonuclease SbcCD nuclease subunit
MDLPNTFLRDTKPLRITVPGLERSTRVLHLTDSHICIPDPDTPFEADCRADRARRPAKEQEDRYANLMSRVADSDIDLLLLTGDIVHYPTNNSIQYARDWLDGTGKPWLYIGGNHDWYFPGQQPNTNLRAQQLPRLTPLFGAHEPALYYSHKVNGLQFLILDNTTYQINAEQLAFAREMLQNQTPTILLIHIPVTQPALRAATIAKWEDPILMGDSIAESRRDIWAWEPDRRETFQFIDLIRAAPNLHAIFCGHVHFRHEERFSESAIQYIGAPGFDGGFRVIDFLPAG